MTEQRPDKNLSEPRSIGAYRLGRTLGEGTYGKVKLGVHMITGQEVAVKILRPEAASDRKSIEREVSILKLLQHPNIVQLFDVIHEESTGRIFLVLELVNGGELFDYIVARGRIQEREARKFFRQILSGLEYCHANLICHRDLKPENLLLDNLGNIKINDFGFSNIIRPGKLFTTFCGSPIYAPPEIIMEKAYVGPEVDIWSLGVILYALVTGQLPWRLGKNARIEDIDDLLKGHFEFPRNVTLSREVQDLIRKMVVADGKKRSRIDDIKNHPWTREGYMEQVSPHLPSRPPIVQIRPDVLAQLEMIGFNMEEARRQILSNEVSATLNVYYLLCERTIPIQVIEKNGMKSIEDIHTPNTNTTTTTTTTSSSNRNANNANNPPPQVPQVAWASTNTARQQTTTPPTSSSPPSTANTAAPQQAPTSPFKPRRRSVNLGVTPPRSPLPDQWTPTSTLTPVIEEDLNETSNGQQQVIPSNLAPFERAVMAAATAAHTQQQSVPPPIVSKPRRHSFIEGGSSRPLTAINPSTPSLPIPHTPSKANLFSRLFRKKSDAEPPVDITTINITSTSTPNSPVSAPTTMPLVSESAGSGVVSGKSERKTPRRRLSLTLGMIPLLSNTPPSTTAMPTDTSVTKKDSYKLRTVKGAFSVDTTTTKEPSEVVREIGRVLTAQGIEFKLKGYVFKAKGFAPASEGMGELEKEGRVSFEMEVCKISNLNLNGVKFKRTGGSVWAYRAICVNLVKEMKI